MEETAELRDYGLVDGVTTNPSPFAERGITANVTLCFFHDTDALKTLILVTSTAKYAGSGVTTSGMNLKTEGPGVTLPMLSAARIRKTAVALLVAKTLGVPRSNCTSV